jgi:hypothetical protein
MHKIIFSITLPIAMLFGCASDGDCQKMTRDGGKTFQCAEDFSVTLAKAKAKAKRFNRLTPYEDLQYVTVKEKSLNVNESNILGRWKCDEGVVINQNVISKGDSWYTFEKQHYTENLNISATSLQFGYIEMAFTVKGRWKLEGGELIIQPNTLERTHLIDDPWEGLYLYTPLQHEKMKKELLVRRIEKIPHLSKKSISFVDEMGTFSSSIRDNT